MFSGNGSAGPGWWERGGAAGAEGPVDTCSPAPPFSRGAYERLALLLGALALLGAGGSLLVLVVYYKSPRLRAPTHLLLVHVSLGDLLASLCGGAFAFAACLRNGRAWDAAGCAWDGFCGSLLEKSSSHKCTCDAF